MQDSNEQQKTDSPAGTDVVPSTTVASSEVTRIHHADVHSSAFYWNLHMSFLAVVFLAVVVILLSKIPEQAEAKDAAG